MANDILQVADDFWNIRGSFRIAGLIDVGTQASLVRLANGNFVFLGAYSLVGDPRRRELRVLAVPGVVAPQAVHADQHHVARRPPAAASKWALIRRVAEMTARMHTHGMNHRDLYICHFLLQRPWSGPDRPLHLYLIDLHRVQIRKAVPHRWRVKDLAALYFSALHIGLGRRDLYRFIRWYTGAGLRDALQGGQAALWQEVERRALHLERTKPVVREVQTNE